jgi:lipoyl-dependent peroxiredoxin
MESPDGRSATLDGTFEVSLTTPKELGGPAASANPEKLFAV